MIFYSLNFLKGTGPIRMVFLGFRKAENIKVSYFQFPSRNWEWLLLIPYFNASGTSLGLKMPCNTLKNSLLVSIWKMEVAFLAILRPVEVMGEYLRTRWASEIPLVHFGGYTHYKRTGVCGWKWQFCVELCPPPLLYTLQCLIKHAAGMAGKNSCLEPWSTATASQIR